MKTQGIQISNTTENNVSISLSEILQEIQNGNELYWSILFLDVIGNIKEARSDFADSVSDMEKGLFIEWEELKTLAQKCHQIIEILILGCTEKQFIQRYDDDQKAYETCDIVIERIDGEFWEIFSKDQSLIQRLGSKFKKIKYLDSDHLTVYLNRKSEGLKIEDSNNEKENLNLSTILSVINGKEYYWSILSIDAYGVGQDLTITNIQRKAHREHGFFIRWEELQFFATKLEQVISVTIVCDKAAPALKHYENLQEQCDNCEIVIKRIENSYWELFSKDAELLQRLKAKFRDVEYLDPRFSN